MARTRRRQATDDVVRAAGAVVDAAIHDDPDELLDSIQALGDAVYALDEIEADDVDSPGHAANNPGRDTQHIAASLTLPSQRSYRRKVIRLARIRPMQGFTCDEAEEWTAIPHASMSSAVNWAIEAGWLHDSGTRRFTRTGRPAIVWVLTDGAVNWLYSNAHRLEREHDQD